MLGTFVLIREIVTPDGRCRPVLTGQPLPSAVMVKK
jgi:hypothetical protein